MNVAHSINKRLLILLKKITHQFTIIIQSVKRGNDTDERKSFTDKTGWLSF